MRIVSTESGPLETVYLQAESTVAVKAFSNKWLLSQW